MDVWLAWWISSGLFSIFHPILIKKYSMRMSRQADLYLKSKACQFKNETNGKKVSEEDNSNLIDDQTKENLLDN